jgi:ABC-type lipoprotein release transport system permease subunit
MGKLPEIARTGLAAIVLHPLRSTVTVLALLAILVPYLAGLGLSKGVQKQAEEAIRFGADIYITGQRFGRNDVITLDTIEQVKLIEGVLEVVPRIVGSITLGDDGESVVMVGVPAERLPPSVECIEGKLYRTSRMDEFVVGTELAKRLKLKIGSLIPPFYHSAGGDRVSKVVGIFRSDISIWQSRLIFTSFDSAARIFNQTGLATDLLVYCRPGYQSAVASAIHQDLSLPAEGSKLHVQPKVTTREELKGLLPRGLLHQEGIFNLHFLLAFIVGILVVLVTSGFGMSERRREVGILKATGWQTDEILLRSMVESFLISLASASLSILLAFCWLDWLNGYWIASIFLAGVHVTPSFKVPFVLAPVPALLCFLISFVVVLSGTLYSTWRAATAPPGEAMR